jgi:hypothetical protein
VSLDIRGTVFTVRSPKFFALHSGGSTQPEKFYKEAKTVKKDNYNSTLPCDRRGPSWLLF